MSAKKFFYGAVLVLFLSCLRITPISAAAPFQGYTYNHWGLTVPAPVSYTATRSIRGTDIDPTIGNFSNPADLAVCLNNNIYLLDSGNNRVVIFNQKLELVNIIAEFTVNGGRETFNSPQGIFVCRNLNIYIADTENRRIVILDNNGDFISKITAPVMDDIDDEIDFRPTRVAVDLAGRVYAIVAHVFEGIMRFDEYGEFFGYFGTIDVRFNPVDMFWRFIATQEQRQRMRRFIPTEFSGLDVDEYGFVFAAHASVGGRRNQVMRLNTQGVDVLRNLNPNIAINGDQIFRLIGVLSGSSVFIDVVARPNGMYSALDSVRRRVYTYCSEGNLLYVFGGTGNMYGMSRRPVAIGAIGDTILVLDAQRNSILYFEPTEYGSLINQAIALRYQGDEEGSLDIWRELLVMDENLTLAFTGIGRAHLLDGNYALAMDYLERGMDLRFYSLALGRRRQAFLEDNLAYVFTGGAVIALGFIAYSVIKRIRVKIREVRHG